METQETHLVEFPLADGGTIFVEVHAPTTPRSGPVTRGLNAEQVTERAKQTFQDALKSIQPAAQAIVTELRDTKYAPDEIHVEFGLDLHAQAGAFIAAASTTANFKIAVTWRNSAP
jgi:hypothetical protein